MVLAKMQSKQSTYQNPILWTDVPDPDVIRVGDVFYMSSTTMHMNPGVPIMKSYDLLHWELVHYVYEELGSLDEHVLNDGKSEYGRGSWASCLRYHNGKFYLAVGSLTTKKTYIFKTADIENGKWEQSVFDQYFHDMSLLFDKDERVYLIYGSDDIKAIELTKDASAIKEGGLHKVIIKSASLVASSEEMVGLTAEGAHIQKVNGYYYVFTITWPKNGNRTQLVHRSTSIDGDYEGRVAVNVPTGIAQGGIVDTTDGDWYGMLFRDLGAVGRTPCLIPVSWEDGWPIFACQGMAEEKFPVPLPEKASSHYIVSSDEFQQDHHQLKLVWQWNHNPDPNNWSLTERSGYLRLRTGSISPHLEAARNTVTQRTFGPVCSGEIAIETAHMKNGDTAGLSAFQKDYGYVAVKMIDGFKQLVMVNANSGAEVEIERIPIQQERVYLRIDFDFRNQVDQAYFYYSLNGKNWRKIGDMLQMKYKLAHFMGYRIALFNFATEHIGGYVDFDYYRVKDTILNT